MSNDESEGRLGRLFITFFKIGLFTFGGGFAMIPMIEREIVHRKRWIQAMDVMDIFAVAQSIPGAIAINAATFVGYKVAGRRGAIVATVGVILPSLVVITIIAAFFLNFQDYTVVVNAFTGVRACIAALIAYAGIKMGKASVSTPMGVVVFLVALTAVVLLKVDAVLVMLGAILLGFGVHAFALLRKAGK